eukprot:TRINITY_DN6627_c0_g1_i2.p1 TRINITY_DN6627_c0_g1~~TRINITY_DN6627_c0_g1_i2.p1  ORF type:complete len:189 (+),score=48.32 TRINITY_DN6627_c0_g1_i2:75-569(+)
MCIRDRRRVHGEELVSEQAKHNKSLIEIVESALGDKRLLEEDRANLGIKLQAAQDKIASVQSQLELALKQKDNLQEMFEKNEQKLNEKIRDLQMKTQALDQSRTSYDQLRKELENQIKSLHRGTTPSIHQTRNIYKPRYKREKAATIIQQTFKTPLRINYIPVS